MSGIEKTRVVGMIDKDLAEFICGICLQLLSDPVVTKCCRQTYCTQCIHQWVSTARSCPNDRKLLRANQLIPSPRLVVNLLNNIHIKCDYQSNGCKIITTIGQLSEHLKSCRHRPKITCKTCGSLENEDEEHNCVDNLIAKNNSIVDENKRLIKENKRLVEENQKLKKRCNGSTTSSTVALIGLAKHYGLEDKDAESPVNKKRLSVNGWKEVPLQITRK